MILCITQSSSSAHGDADVEADERSASPPAQARYLYPVSHTCRLSRPRTTYLWQIPGRSTTITVQAWLAARFHSSSCAVSMASSYRSSPHSRTRDLPVLECTRAPRYKACATAHVRQRFLSHDIIRRVLRRPVRLAKHYLSLSSASPRWLTSGVLARTGCVRRRSASQALLAPSRVCVHVSPQRPAGSGGFVTCAGARRQTCMVLLEKRTAPELDGYTLGAFAARSPVWQRPPEEIQVGWCVAFCHFTHLQLRRCIHLRESSPEMLWKGMGASYIRYRRQFTLY